MLGPGKAEARDHEFKVSLSYLSETLTWSSVSWKERERARELCGVAIVYFPWDRGTRGQLSLCLQSWHLPWASVACAIFVPIWFLHHILVWNVIVILYGYCFSLQLRLFQRLLSASVQTLFTISRQLESSARICKCCLHTQRQHGQRWGALSPPLQPPLFSCPQVSCSLGTSLTDPLCLCSPPVCVCPCSYFLWKACCQGQGNPKLLMWVSVNQTWGTLAGGSCALTPSNPYLMWVFDTTKESKKSGRTR